MNKMDNITATKKTTDNLKKFGYVVKKIDWFYKPKTCKKCAWCDQRSGYYFEFVIDVPCLTENNKKMNVPLKIIFKFVQHNPQKTDFRSFNLYMKNMKDDRNLVLSFKNHYRELVSGSKFLYLVQGGSYNRAITYTHLMKDGTSSGYFYGNNEYNYHSYVDSDLEEDIDRMYLDEDGHNLNTHRDYMKRFIVGNHFMKGDKKVRCCHGDGTWRNYYQDKSNYTSGGSKARDSVDKFAGSDNDVDNVDDLKEDANTKSMIVMTRTFAAKVISNVIKSFARNIKEVLPQVLLKQAQ